MTCSWVGCSKGILWHYCACTSTSCYRFLKTKPCPTLLWICKNKSSSKKQYLVRAACDIISLQCLKQQYEKHNRKQWIFCYLNHWINFFRCKIKSLVSFYKACLPVYESNQSISLMLPVIINQAKMSTKSTRCIASLNTAQCSTASVLLDQCKTFLEDFNKVWKSILWFLKLLKIGFKSQTTFSHLYYPRIMRKDGSEVLTTV